MKDKIIKLEAELDLTKDPAEVRITAVDGIWMDFGYYLEVMAFMCKNVAGYKEEPVDKVIDYATNYLKKASKDYKRNIK